MISALGRQDHSDYVLIKMVADNGLIGIGEATVSPRWSGETARGAQVIIEDLFGPALIGLDPSEIAELEERLDALAVGNWFAKAALEMACWDLSGKEAGKAVFELLGGSCRPLTIPNRFSLGAYAPSVAAERAAERVEDGFEMIKIKVGTDPITDIQRVRAVRAAGGTEISLIIDANGGWSLKEAINTIQELDDCRLDWVEQPISRDCITGLRTIRQETGARILADESCFNEEEALELLEGECCDALSLYPGKQGGISRAIRIAEIAEQFRIPCSVGSNLEWDVATAAMLHFIVATPNLRVEELPGDCLGPSYHECSVVRDPIPMEGNRTTLPQRPGLGVELDWDLVQRNRFDRP